MKIAKLEEKINHWQSELDRIHAVPNRWGEHRRFAGRSAGIRLERIDWLISHISTAKVKIDCLLAT